MCESDLSRAKVPLVVDVDGTLVGTDLLVEGIRRIAAVRPGELPAVAAALAGGRAALKASVAERSDIDVGSLALDPAVRALMRRVREAGRPVGLASAADARLVEGLAERVSADFAFASDGEVNLRGERKLERVLRQFDVFDYVGDSWSDLPLFREARRSWVVRPGPLLAWWCRRAGRDVRRLG